VRPGRDRWSVVEIGFVALIAVPALLSAVYGATIPERFGVQTVLNAVGGAVVAGSAAVAVLGFGAALWALVTDGLPAGLDTGDRRGAAPVRRGRYETLAVLAAVLTLLAALSLTVPAGLGDFPVAGLGVVFLAVALPCARVARRGSPSGSWPRVVATVCYVWGVAMLVVALAAWLSLGNA